MIAASEALTRVFESFAQAPGASQTSASTKNRGLRGVDEPQKAVQLRDFRHLQCP
jgi:hypothetical protein